MASQCKAVGNTCALGCLELLSAFFHFTRVFLCVCGRLTQDSMGHRSVKCAVPWPRTATARLCSGSSALQLKVAAYARHKRVM